MVDEQPDAIDSDHIRSAVTPVHDVCELKLQIHLEPAAGTCTIKVRTRTI
jgi:hypothetical protein